VLGLPITSPSYTHSPLSGNYMSDEWFGEALSGHPGISSFGVSGYTETRQENIVPRKELPSMMSRYRWFVHLRRLYWRVRVEMIQRAESRRFYRKHGPVVRIEPMPKGRRPR
jgi:hypothetical protein